MPKVRLQFKMWPFRNRALDLDFYQNLYSDLSHFEKVDLEKHFQEYGKKEKRFPNRKFLDSSWRKKKPLHPFDWNLYCLINSDLNFESELAVKDHYIRFGVREQRLYEYATTKTSELLLKYVLGLFEFIRFDDLNGSKMPIGVDEIVEIIYQNIDEIFRVSKTQFETGSTQRERLFIISEWMLRHSPSPMILRDVIAETKRIVEEGKSAKRVEHAEFLACLHIVLFSGVLGFFVPELQTYESGLGKNEIFVLGASDKTKYKEKWFQNFSTTSISVRRNLSSSENLFHQSKSSSSCNANPKVSLIASVFNGDKFLNHYIKNIIALDNFENMELILVDANSYNPVKKKLEVYLETYPNIKVVTLKTTNTIYESWNLAIEMASGEYLTNVNVDDLRLKSAVMAQATFLDENHEVDVIYGNYLYSLKPNTSIQAALKLNISTNLPALTTHNLLEFNSPHCAPMWRKSLHSEIGHFDESFKSAGDWEFWLRAAKAEKKFACLKDPIAIYYWNPRGISTGPNSTGVSEQWEIRKRYRQMLIDESVTIGSVVRQA